MITMNMSLPEILKDFVDDQASARGYSTSTEYVREPIRKDQDRLRLRNLFLEGAASPPAGAADEDDFDQLRGRVSEADEQ